MLIGLKITSYELIILHIQLQFKSDEEQQLRHVRRIIAVYVHRNYKRAQPYDIGDETKEIRDRIHKITKNRK